MATREAPSGPGRAVEISVKLWLVWSAEHRLVLVYDAADWNEESGGPLSRHSDGALHPAQALAQWSPARGLHSPHLHLGNPFPEIPKSHWSRVGYLCADVWAKCRDVMAEVYQ